MSGKKHKVYRWVAKILKGAVSKRNKKEFKQDKVLSSKMLNDWKHSRKKLNDRH